MRLFGAAVVLVCVAAGTAEDALPWWRTATFYQVYQRSFKDSDGDGIGDLKGVTEKANYLKEIGVDAIWLSPFNRSPMRDFGYDIMEFREIDPLYGTMADFEKMVATFKTLDIKVVMDFVPNHTSDKHLWFQASINTSHPLHQYYKDFYVWLPAKGWTPDGKPIPPNNWISVFSGTAWEWVEDRQMFYLHQFTKEQPDLNYREPNVVSNMTEMFQYWLDKGIDGFRMDATKFIFENASFPDEILKPGSDGTNYELIYHNYTNNQPETFQLLTQWTDMLNERVLRDGRPKALFNEVYDELKEVMKYYGTGNRSMQITFNFDLVGGSPYSTAGDVQGFIDSWMEAMPNGSVPNWVIGNHDHLRTADTYGPELVDAMNMLTAVLPGVKCVYYGEEIGMQDGYISWNHTVDPRGQLVGPDHYREQSRDPERTPMQWDVSTSAGFSTNSTTWLPVNPNYWWLNVEAQRAAPASHLKVFQAMTKVRRDPVLQRGDYKVIVQNHNNTLLVTRSYDGSYYVLIINLGDETATYTSQNLFDLNKLDQDMILNTTSLNSGLTTGMKLNRGVASISLRPKAAILLRSSPTESVQSASSRLSVGFILSFVLFSVLLRLPTIGCENTSNPLGGIIVSF